MNPPRRFSHPFHSFASRIERARSNLELRVQLLHSTEQPHTWSNAERINMCRALSLQLTRDDRSLSGSPHTLGIRMRIISCSRKEKDSSAATR